MRVHALPTLVALATAIALTPPLLRHLATEGLVRENWEEEIILTPEGLNFRTGLEKNFASASDH